MAIVTYSNSGFGFGATYDDALLTHTDDAADLRLRATWGARIRAAVAAAVVFAPWDASAEDIARGRAPSLLLTTDAAICEIKEEKKSPAGGGHHHHHGGMGGMGM